MKGMQALPKERMAALVMIACVFQRFHKARDATPSYLAVCVPCFLISFAVQAFHKVRDGSPDEGKDGGPGAEIDIKP